MAKETAARQQAQDNKAETMSFISWFSARVHNTKDVKAHHMAAIKAHFRTLGLSEKETPGAYEKALKNYGI
jgi:hypothetical protein